MRTEPRDARGWDEPRTCVVRALTQAGFVAADAEADALFGASTEAVGSLDELLARRLDGEPLAWITGAVDFCGVRVHVDPGVFVPRAHTEILAKRAVVLLPTTGIPVDLCTGSGAVAVVLARPDRVQRWSPPTSIRWRSRAHAGTASTPSKETSTSRCRRRSEDE